MSLHIPHSNNMTLSVLSRRILLHFRHISTKYWPGIKVVPLSHKPSFFWPTAWCWLLTVTAYTVLLHTHTHTHTHRVKKKPSVCIHTRYTQNYCCSRKHVQFVIERIQWDTRRKTPLSLRPLWMQPSPLYFNVNNPSAISSWNLSLCTSM